MKKLILPLIALILASSMVFAFGVSSPYWEDNPMELSPGESEVVMLNLQNKAGATESVTATIRVLEGYELLSLPQDTYEVAAGGETDVPVTVTIPSNAEAGDTYSIRMEVKEATSGEGGMVAMGTGFLVEFNINIVEGAGIGMNTTTILSIIAIVIAAIIIYCLLRRKKK